jgi:hypothetical protein
VSLVCSGFEWKKNWNATGNPFPCGRDESILNCPVSKWCIELHPSSLTRWLLLANPAMNSLIVDTTLKLKINPSYYGSDCNWFRCCALGICTRVQLQQRDFLSWTNCTRVRFKWDIIITPEQSCMMQFQWFPQWKALEVDRNWNALLFNKLPYSILVNPHVVLFIFLPPSTESK